MSEAATAITKAPSEINFGAVPDKTLLNVLRRRGYFISDDDCDEDGGLVDGSMLSLAGDYFRRGDVAEALIWLERALPDTFAGLATAAVPARSS